MGEREREIEREGWIEEERGRGIVREGEGERERKLGKVVPWEC